MINKIIQAKCLVCGKTFTKYKEARKGNRCRHSYRPARAKTCSKRCSNALHYVKWQIFLILSLFILSNVSAFENFTIAILPDTQKFTPFEESFDVMTQWITNHSELNTKMVLHVGDVVTNHNSNIEYIRAKRSMDILTNASIPYLVIAGNHDYWTPTENNWTNFNTYFEGMKKGLMNISGYQIGFAGMHWNPTDEEINETRQFIENNSDYQFIVFTHEYLFDYNYTTTYGWHPGAIGPPRIYNGILKDTPNIILIINGHWSGDYGYINNRSNHTFYEFMFDYQDWGIEKGEIRLFQFNPNENSVKGSTMQTKINNESINFSFNYKMNPYLFPNYLFWNETIENFTIIERNETIEYFDNETNQTTYNITFFNETIWSNTTIEYSNLTYLDYDLTNNLSREGEYFGNGVRQGYTQSKDEPPSQGGSGNSGGGGGGGGSSSSIRKGNITIEIVGLGVDLPPLVQEEKEIEPLKEIELTLFQKILLVLINLKQHIWQISGQLSQLLDQ